MPESEDALREEIGSLRSQLVEAEKEIARARQRDQLARQAANIGYWELTPSTGHLQWSPEVLPLVSGHPSGEMETTLENFTKFIHPDDIDRVNRVVAESAEKRSSFKVDYRVIHFDGSLHWLQGWGGHVEDADGRHRMIGAVIDITQRKKAEQQTESANRALVEQTSELTAVNKELEAFAYSVSHDLRGPLRAIDGFSGILLEEHTDQLDTEGRRLLTVVRENSGLMGQLIEDILELSRIGRSAMERARIDMRKVVAAAVQQAQQQQADRELPIKVHDLPPAVGDERLIQQVWINLLSNAAKFTAPRESPAIEVRGVVENNEHVYSVKDNGAGFDMKYSGKLFSLFERLHSREEFAGTGVGLAIVKRIVERHGGRVWAEGKVNEGATFYFTLPKSG